MTGENMSEENTPEHAPPPLAAYTRSAWRPAAVRTAERTVAGLTRRYENMVTRPADALAWPATLRGRVERRGGSGRSAGHPMAGHPRTSPGSPVTARQAPAATPAPDEADDAAAPGVTTSRTGPPSPGIRTVRATPVSPAVQAVRVAPETPRSPAAAAEAGHAAHTEATAVKYPPIDEAGETGAGTAEADDRQARGGGVSAAPPPGWAPATATRAGTTTDLLGRLFDALTAPREMPEFTVRAADEPHVGGPQARETPPGRVPSAAAGEVRATGLPADRTGGRPDGTSTASPGDGRPPTAGTHVSEPRAAAAHIGGAPGLRASEIRQVADRVGEMLLRRQEIERERGGG